MSNQKLRPPNNNLFSKLIWHNSEIIVEFKRSWLKQDDLTFTLRNSVLVVYESDALSRDFNTIFTLKGCLFRAVKVTGNMDLDKYSYSGYGIGFGSRWLFQS